jgi:hypothetical protein
MEESKLGTAFERLTEAVEKDVSGTWDVKAEARRTFWKGTGQGEPPACIWASPCLALASLGLPMPRA